METRKLTTESTPIFQEGVGLILSRWSALTAAVENEWGGRDSGVKANMLCSDVISFFTESKGNLFYLLYLKISHFFFIFAISVIKFYFF